MKTRPQPWFHESLQDYADRCGETVDAVRVFWDAELGAMHARWRKKELDAKVAAAVAPPPLEAS